MKALKYLLLLPAFAITHAFADVTVYNTCDATIQVGGIAANDVCSGFALTPRMITANKSTIFKTPATKGCMIYIIELSPTQIGCKVSSIGGVVTFAPEKVGDATACKCK